jgi:hypothetical protein
LYWSTYNNYLISGSDDRSLMVWETEVNYEWNNYELREAISND